MHTKFKIILFSVLIFGSVSAQETIYLDLDSALRLAENNNRLIRIFQYKIENAEGQLNEMKSHYYPRIVFEGIFAYNSDPDIHVKKGEFNHIYEDLIDVKWIDDILEEYFPLPPKNMVLVHGDNYFYKTNLSLYQPLTQLTTVNTGRKVAETDLLISEIEKKNIVSEIKLGVTELFYGILLQTKLEEWAYYELEYKKAEYNDASNAYEEGQILGIDVKGLDAEIYEQEQELIAIRNKKDSYILSFKQLTGLDYNTTPVLILDSVNLSIPSGLDVYQSSAFQKNFDLRISELTLQKANLGIDASKKGYIPELSYFFQYNYNKGIPLYPENYFITGLNLQWTLLASGERASKVKQSNALFNEAREDFEYTKQTIRNEVESAYLNMDYAIKLIQTAAKALNARTEELTLAEDAVLEGEALNTTLLQAKADLAKAEADHLGAQLNYMIQMAKLKRLTGEERQISSYPVYKFLEPG